MNILGFVISMSQQSFVLLMGVVVVFVACILLAFRTSRTSENVEKIENVLDVLVGVKVSGKSWPVVKKTFIEHGIIQADEPALPATSSSTSNDTVVLPEISSAPLVVLEEPEQVRMYSSQDDPDLDDYNKWRTEQGMPTSTEVVPVVQTPTPLAQNNGNKVQCDVCGRYFEKKMITLHKKQKHKVENGQSPQPVPQQPMPQENQPQEQNLPTTQPTTQPTTTETKTSASPRPPTIPEPILKQLPASMQSTLRKTAVHYGSTCHCTCNHPVVAMCEALNCKCCM